MKLPPLSHLQVVVLRSLGSQRMSGIEVRSILSRKKLLRSSPAFYQFMSRLEKENFIEGEYASRLVGGNSIKERFYCITNRGEHALRATIRFYSELANP